MKNYNLNSYHTMDAIRIGEILAAITKIDKTIADLYERSEHAAENTSSSGIHICGSHGHSDDDDSRSLMSAILLGPEMHKVKRAKCVNVKIDDKTTLTILGILISNQTNAKKRLIGELKGFGIVINDIEL